MGGSHERIFFDDTSVKDSEQSFRRGYQFDPFSAESTRFSQIVGWADLIHSQDPGHER